MPAPAPSRRGTSLVLAAAVLWGTTGTTQALAPASATPQAVGAARVALAAVTLVLVSRSRAHWRRVLRRPAFAVAAACTAAYQLAFFEAVSRTGVALGTILAIGSAPVLAGGLARVVRHEALTARWAAATTLAVAGAALLVSGPVRLAPAGAALAVCAGASYAGYALASKALLADVPPPAATAAVFAGGALLLSPLLVTQPLGWLLRPAGLAAAVHLGVFATAVAYLLFAAGLRTVAVGRAATLSLAEPLVAMVLGVAVLGERPPPTGAAGAALVLTGLALASR